MSRYHYVRGDNMMNEKKIIISKKSEIKGEDGYKTFSVRIKEETVKQLDDIAGKTNRYRNELINIFLNLRLRTVRLRSNKTSLPT